MAVADGCARCGELHSPSRCPHLNQTSGKVEGWEGMTVTYPIAPLRHGDPRFYKLLEEIAELHSKKSYDYTPAGDPLANFKRSEKLGVPAWKGCLVRMGDKQGRIEQLASGKDPQNESLRDSLIDNAVYSLLCVLLLEDAQ